MSKNVASVTHETVKSFGKSQSSKKLLISKTLQVGTSTLASRLLGLLREFLTSKYLGVGEMADAFLTAFKIPNSLRKIFAEGALSAACIPKFVSVIKNESKQEASSLMTISFLVFEGILIAFCGLIFWQADAVIRLIAPGWYASAGTESLSSSIPMLGKFFEWFAPAWYLASQGSPQTYYAVIYLRILISFIIFLSSSSLLAGALQAANHFFIPAISSAVLNVAFIGGLVACLKCGLSVEWLCSAILFGGLLQFLLHLGMYFKLQFKFGSITWQSLRHFKHIMHKFLPCLLSMSILELNLFMSTSLATYLPKGSIALLYYANRFMGIPLGVLIGAFSTILLPYFSRITTYAPQRLSIYLLEASKVVFWVTIPCTIVMSILSEKIFHTIFLSEKFSLLHVQQAAHLLIIFLAGLFFFSLYKILLNIFYALHDTKTPCYTSLAVLGINYGLCKLLAPYYGVNGLALAFVITNVMHVALFSLLLALYFNFKFYFYSFFKFVMAAGTQIVFVTSCFTALYAFFVYAIQRFLSPAIQSFLLYRIGFWLWAGPLCMLCIFVLIRSRKLFNVKLYFLD